MYIIVLTISAFPPELIPIAIEIDPTVAERLMASPTDPMATNGDVGPDGNPLVFPGNNIDHVTIDIMSSVHDKYPLQQHRGVNPLAQLVTPGCGPHPPDIHLKPAIVYKAVIHTKGVKAIGGTAESDGALAIGKTQAPPTKLPPKKPKRKIKDIIVELDWWSKYYVTLDDLVGVLWSWNPFTC